MAKETAKKTAAEREKQRALLEGFRGELEAGRPLGALELSKADQARLSGLRFLTAIPALVGLNVDEDVAADGGRLEELVGSLPLAGRKAACFSAKFEAELGDIEDPKERDEFMQQYGIAESARVKLARAAVETLGQVTFLTANPNEVHAWLVREGATAPEAAGRVHTDFEQGFIRAERMVLEELEAAGSESALRERGRVELKGKDYLVQDGDILHILASR
jgi:ribosome-binding ATPase YchF (GTP1/OBG family)